MAAPTIINQESFGGNLGEKLGQSLGQGLSSGLQQLANQKLERMQKKNALHELRTAFPDVPEEAVAYIASKPAKEQLQILEMLGNQKRQQQEQQMAQQQAEIQQMQQPQVAPQQQMQAQGQGQQEEMVLDEAYINDLEQALNTPSITANVPPAKVEEARNQLEMMKQQLANNPVGVNPFGGQKSTQQEPQQMQPPVEQSKGGIPLTALGKDNKNALAQDKQALAREKFEFEKQQAKEKMSAAIKEAEETPVQKKYKEEVTSAYSTYDDLLETAKRMLRNSKENDISTGFISNLQYGIDPTTLDDSSESFGKDSDHIVNLTSSALKGVMSKYRVQKLEAEKPSLRHGKKVNEELLEGYIKMAEKKLRQIEKDNPKIQFERISDMAQQDEQQLAQEQPLEYPQFFEENTQYDPEDGSGKIYILKNGTWEEM